MITRNEVHMQVGFLGLLEFAGHLGNYNIKVNFELLELVGL